MSNNKTLQNLKSKKAFTLVELLVVMAIIGSLVAISVVGITQAFKSSRDNTRLQDIRNIQLKLVSYLGQFNRYPNAANGEIQISPDGKKMTFYNANVEYGTLDISQPGLNSALVTDHSGFCTTTKATADIWYLMYETGTAQRPQDYALQACLEIGASANLGNRNISN